MFILNLFRSGAPLILSILLLQSSAHSIIAATFQVANSPLLQLTVGLNVSVGDLMAQIIVAGYGDGYADADGTFWPMLSSPGFNSTDPQESSGFSFGFFSPSRSELSKIYLAVCGGVSGSSSSVSSIASIRIGVGNIQTISMGGSYAAGSYAVPVWMANTNYPLSSINSSLVVMSGAQGNGNVLQLRDQNGAIVWRVNNVGLMEMKDSGNLIIYDTIDKNQVVWQSLTQPRDTLVQNQKLSAGMELTSNDSSYLARMEKGGLVFYLTTAQFIERPSPYWAIPISQSELQLKEQVLASPCGPNKTAYTMLDTEFSLDLGCTSHDVTSYSLLEPAITYYTWSFLKLGNDGSLHLYIVDTTENPPSTTPSRLQQLAQNNFVDWGDCDAPMACGPLGVCTPNVTSSCACPNPSQEGIKLFDFIDPTDTWKGCTRVTPLPDCIRGDEHINTTSYLQMNETTSTFLLSGWPFASTTATRVDICKKLCSYNCSCTGFFYKAANTSSACFFITDDIGLLDVKNRTMIAARSYVTYLKFNISSTLAPSPNHESTIQATSANNGQHESNTGQPTSANNGKHEYTIAIAAVSSFVACSLTLGLMMYIFIARRQSKAKDKARQAEEAQLRDILPLLPSRFSYQDLHKATGGFSKLLGAGGYGSVYAGVLLDGRKIAVKVLESGILKGHQTKQFLAELAAVGRTSHHNIVCLIGFCWEVSHRVLVYEYMERGSLDQWLFVAKGVDGETTPLLDWQTRYIVALGIARGLTYLHEECPQPILHFDIKPQNILLDDTYVAKLADFGLSKLMQKGVSEVVTVVRGTPGYIAPEWLSHGAVNKKCDIYSMGMVMLEIVGGRKNVDLTMLSGAANEWHFPSWAAKKCEKGFMLELVDKRLAQAYDKEQACRLIETAFWCIHENASMRPYAPTELQWLEGTSPVKPPPFSAIAHALSSTEVTST